MKNLVAKLIAMFNLAQDATEDQIVAKLEAYKSERESLVAGRTKITGALGLKPEATIEEIEGLIVAGKSTGANIQQMATELATLKQERLTEKFDGVIARGIATGRILPAQKDDPNWIKAARDWGKADFVTFEAYYTSKAPVIGPVPGQVDDAIAGSGNLRASGVTDTDLEVGRKMGLTKEQIEKYNK